LTCGQKAGELAIFDRVRESESRPDWAIFAACCLYLVLSHKK
jgi:hypothetical protein